MMTVKQLVQTCTNEWERILIYTSEEGLIGAYFQLEALSDDRKNAVVRTWNYRDKALYILI